jgi:uncharacterized membrane protein SpoIIM required for sporulation
VNRKQLIVLWLLAAWLLFSFFWAARHVEEPGMLERGKARVTGAAPPAPTVTYQFVWERDAGAFLLLAIPGLILGIPLILTLGRKK